MIRFSPNQFRGALLLLLALWLLALLRMIF